MKFIFLDYMYHRIFGLFILFFLVNKQALNFLLSENGKGALIHHNLNDF